jgi:hypothetical protein
MRSILRLNAFGILASYPMEDHLLLTLSGRSISFPTLFANLQCYRFGFARISIGFFVEVSDPTPELGLNLNKNPEKIARNISIHTGTFSNIISKISVRFL